MTKKSSSSRKTPFEEYLETADKLTRQINSVVKPFLGPSNAFAQLTAKVTTLIEEYRDAIVSGLSNFTQPKDYDPSRVTIKPNTRELAKREAQDLLERVKEGPFSYMYVRLSVGVKAHLDGNYHISIFVFLSILDGLLTRFFQIHNDYFDSPDRFPSFKQELDHFMAHYKDNEIFVKGDEFRQRLEAFFEHRNEIMHGGRLVYFDENISVIGVLILSIVYVTVEKEYQLKLLKGSE